MVMSEGLLPTLGEIIAQSQGDFFGEQASSETVDTRLKAEREWSGAIAALEQLLLHFHHRQDDFSGLILSSPSPILSDPELSQQLHTGIFTPKSIPEIARSRAILPAASPCPTLNLETPEYPLIDQDPLAQERFGFVLTQEFGLLFALSPDPQGQLKFRFSFDPQVLKLAWQALRSRLVIINPGQLCHLDPLIQKFPIPNPNYRLVTAFSHQLLNHLPDLCTPTLYTDSTGDLNPILTTPEEDSTRSANTSEVELLQALTHEIRTPLTTIRMLTRLLLKKRRHLGEDVIKRLEGIDQECTEQINRMELIFRAAEMETQSQHPNQVQLVPISLSQVIQQHIPQWQKQAQRRNVILDVWIPEQLPTVVSNPDMLARALSGLMESFTRSVSTGGKLQVQVSTAGHQLKLQMQSKEACFTHSLQAMGQLLMFQPSTGSLSLNLNVTKNLFQALGGKFTVRQKPEQGEILTIFLPLGIGCK